MSALGARALVLTLAVVCLPAGGCRRPHDSPSRPRVILLSIDGFRHDFGQRGATPHLDGLAARGVAANKLRPVFPSKTFPNHYTLVTGLYPEHHGLVANTMYDPEFDAIYRLSDRAEVGDGRWYDAEPLWVTAERQGVRTAPVFWPGSEAEIGGIRPTWWEPFDGSLTDNERVDRLLALLDLEPDERPRFLTLYFNSVDDAAHRFGPQPSPQLESAVERVDRAVGHLLDGLADRGLLASTNLVVVSDHGMAASSRDRVIVLDHYLDPGTANPVDWDPVLALWPDADLSEEVFRRLDGAHPRLRVYRRDDIPPELHYRTHRRIPPIIAVADPGWAVTSSRRLATCEECFTGGNHGFDPRSDEMAGIFIAAGPAFRRGARLDTLETVHIYELLCALLELEALPNDGSLDAVSSLLTASGE